MPESTGKIVPSGVLERHYSGSGGCLDGVPGGRRQAPPEPLMSGFSRFHARPLTPWARAAMWLKKDVWG